MITRALELFVLAAEGAEDFEVLGSAIGQAVQALGLSYFILQHHLDFSLPADLVIRITNFPSDWTKTAAARHYLRDDPIIAACQQRGAGFYWSSLAQDMTLSPRQREILSHYGACGLGEGYTIPLNAPGEYEGSCSFAAERAAPFPHAARAGLHLIAAFGYDAARRLWRVNLQARRVSPSPKLSNRQLDCILLAARGKSASVSAQLLGISQFTVRQHIEDAKRRFGVSSTRQLIVHSLFDRQITFADLLGRDENAPSSR